MKTNKNYNVGDQLIIKENTPVELLRLWNVTVGGIYEIAEVNDKSPIPHIALLNNKGDNAGVTFSAIERYMDLVRISNKKKYKVGGYIELLPDFPKNMLRSMDRMIDPMGTYEIVEVDEGGVCILGKNGKRLWLVAETIEKYTRYEEDPMVEFIEFVEGEVKPVPTIGGMSLNLTNGGVFMSPVIEEPLDPGALLEMIDLALMTGDKVWFAELTKQLEEVSE